MGASPYCKSQRVYGTHENHTEPSWDVTDQPPKTHNYDHKHDEDDRPAEFCQLPGPGEPV